MKDEKLIKKSMELHFDAFVADQHCDIQMDMVTRRGRLENKVLERHHFPKFKQGGIDFALMSTVPHFGYEAYPFFMNPTLSALELIDCGLMDAAESPDQVSIVTTSAEIREAKKKGKISFMLGIEGAEAIGTNLSVLRNFYRLGVRVMTITWHKRNMAADGSGEPSGSGLTKFGKELIQEMNRIKMVVDVSHISEAGFWDIMQCSESPVIASHSNARNICDHPRNLYDDQIMALAKKGGIVGICFCSPYVHPQQASVAEVVDHIDHIAALSGPESIALGPDWIDYAEDMVIACMDPKGYLAKGSSITTFAKGLENARKLPNLTIELMARGYTEKEIRGILGENFLRVLDEILTTKEQEINR